MDFLDLSVHSLILNDLARNLASTASHASSIKAADELSTRVQDELDNGADLMDDEKEVMSSALTHVNISFSTFCSHLPPSHGRTSNNINLLLDLLGDIPSTNFELGLGWQEWALPDQLTYGVLGALLKVSGELKDLTVTAKVLEEVGAFTTALGKRIEEGDPIDVIIHSMPIFNGLYRSLTSIAHPFTLSSFIRLASSINTLIVPKTINRLNQLLLDPSSLFPPRTSTDPNSAEEEDSTRASLPYANALLARYRSDDRPLSGNLLICAGLEMQFTMLAQILVPAELIRTKVVPLGNDSGEGAEASNAAWAVLLSGAAEGLEGEVEGSDKEALTEIMGTALRSFADMSSTIQTLRSQPSVDLYPYEVVSESLKLATLCSVALGQPDASLLSRIKILLSENAPIYEAMVQEAALQSLVILVHNFPSLAHPMALHLRRFVAAPLQIFDVDHSTSLEGSRVLVAAARCLAVCIKTAEGDDLISSTMYSLLNYLTSSSSNKETSGPGQRARSVRSALQREEDHLETMTVHTTAGGTFIGTRTDEQKRKINASTIAVVTRLAMEFKQSEVTHVTISMLLQRLRGADPHTEAIIVGNLVPLALVAPRLDFIDVIKALSSISRSSNPEDPSHSSSAVLEAQTRLGRELKNREDEFCDIYLVELLQLFADRGTNVQMLAAGKREGDHLSKRPVKDNVVVSELTDQLAGLLLPIDAVLAHDTFDPHHSPTPELVALFRNMWFICVVLGIPRTLKDWHLNALERIAFKTPALVLESAHDYVSSDLEYNSILRKDFSPVVIARQRAALSEILPGHAYEFKTFTLAQITLLQTIYTVEGMRTKLGRPSFLLSYFSNESVNESVLVKPLDSIAAKIIGVYRDELTKKALAHAIPATISDELQKLLIGCTHRFKKVRDVSFQYLNVLMAQFPSLMCEAKLVFSLLEVLTILRNSCEEQYTDEYSPVYEHSSTRVDIKLQLSDSFTVRNEITTTLGNYARAWLTNAIARAPIEVQTVLQRYLAESRDVLLPDSVEMGAGLALHYSKIISSSDRKETSMPAIGGWASDNANLLASQFAAKNYFAGEHSGFRLILKQGLRDLQQDSPSMSSFSEIIALKGQMATALKAIDDKTSTFSIPDLRRLLFRAAAVLISSGYLDNDILHFLVTIPIRAFSPRSVAAGVDAWTWLVSERPEFEMALLSEVVAGWTWTIESRKGLFSKTLNTTDPFVHPIEYSPSNKEIMDKGLAAAQRLLAPHLLLIQILTSRFQAVKIRESGLMLSLIQLLLRSSSAAASMSTHPLAREARFSLVLFGLQVLESSRLEAVLELKLRDRLFDVAFSWFAARPQWSYGSNRNQVNAEIKLLGEVLVALHVDKVRAQDHVSSIQSSTSERKLPSGKSLREYNQLHGDRLHLLQLLIENEISRLSVWQNTLGEASSNRNYPQGADRSAEPWGKAVRTAWAVSPAVAVHMVERLKNAVVTQEVTNLVRSRPKDVIDVPEALHYLLGDRIDHSSKKNLQWLLLWAAVPPVTAVSYFQPRFDNNPIVLQYAMRVLEQHPVQLTFFFVPQVVQALRTDTLGYVERFIFETSKVSQLFCHQIIWNMKANTYKDDSASEPDPMKPMLDRMVDRVVASLSGEARAFYDREFTFFNEVTDISGKLKPFIKKTKPEKKAKIDEEMAKIVVDAGVYLPSNPDGVVVDIDKKSGRPLQSHAKAPFMATFKVRKELIVVESPAQDNVISETDEDQEVEGNKGHYDVWQAAIFKVGDDCRQDVLALQIIAMFKNIFSGIGLALYLFPYRVTATAPGCGVIDVVPNATSRDEMGRAKVNDLLSFFVDKYGSVDTIPFQKARMNFIQSMAAYSIACYILQIKDRHNGNIMIDGEGHIVHIDFGFLFDIGPGGVKFEPNSFKLNHEMVVLMGGRDSQGYRIFQELTVKAFLAIRPHADQLVDTVHLMLETGLPSFKGEPTIKRLRDRFQLGLTEKGAAEYMVGIIKNAHENKRSTFYDEFQRLQNGIPYAG